MADFAVVVPTLDEEATIADCLAAVGRGAGLEVVVVDGGSRDRTPEIAAAAGARVVQGARGRGPQLNRGAAETCAAMLLFLHADCRLPAAWQPALAAALRQPAAALACFRLHTEPAEGTGAGRWSRLWLRALDLRSHLPLLPYGDQGFALRREVFEGVGGFPEIPLMEDLQLAAACRRLGRIVRLPLVMRTSARRFQQRPLRARLATLSFPLLFRLGVSPHRLARWYGEAR